MKRRMLMVSILALLGLLACACFAGAAERGALREDLKLYPAPGKKDPYSLFYDFKVKSPGMVRVALDVTRVVPDKGIPRWLVRVSLLRKGEKKAFRQNISAKGGKLEYSVDAMELEKTGGEYRVIVSNFSRKHTVLAKLRVLYPGEGQGSSASVPAPRCDLAVGEISINDQGFLAVELKNVGEAAPPSVLWSKELKPAPTLMLEIDGKSWGGAAIWGIDRRHALSRPGGSVVYVSKYRVTSTVKVKAELEGLERIRDRDRRNNEKTVVLRDHRP